MTTEAMHDEAQPPRYSTELHMNPDDTWQSPSEKPSNGQLQLHRRTSVRIESEPNKLHPEEGSDAFSTVSSLGSGENGILRGFRLRLGNTSNGLITDRISNAQESGTSLESSEYGTTVVIEASRPLGIDSTSRRDMRGLDQAASMSRWIGNTKPPEPWGKLLKVSKGNRGSHKFNKADTDHRIPSFGILPATP